MVSQILEKPITETATFAPVCGQCAYFVEARMRGSQLRPSYCRLLMMADCDDYRKAASDKVCSQYGEAVPF